MLFDHFDFNHVPCCFYKSAKLSTSCSPTKILHQFRRFKEQAVSAYHRTCVWLMAAGQHSRFSSLDAWCMMTTACDVNFSGNVSCFWKMPVDFVLRSQGEELFDLAEWMFHCFLQYRRRNNSQQKKQQQQKWSLSAIGISWCSYQLFLNIGISPEFYSGCIALNIFMGSFIYFLFPQCVAFVVPS